MSRTTDESLGSPGVSVLKNPPVNAEEAGSIPGLERSLGQGNGNPLQYSCLENPMDRGTWKLQRMGVAKNPMWLSSTHVSNSPVEKGPRWKDWKSSRVFLFILLVRLVFSANVFVCWTSFILGVGAGQEVLDAWPQTHDILQLYLFILGLVICVLALLSELPERSFTAPVSEADGFPGGPHPPEALCCGNK